MARGTSVGIKLCSTAQGRKFDPARIHHGDVVLQWATAIWEDYPKYKVMQECLEGAAIHLTGAKHPWKKASDPATVFLLTVRRIGWAMRSARLATTDQGLEIDMLKLAPRA
eukprot:4772912-Heterocapsa_arctica.AAC.1